MFRILPIMFFILSISVSVYSYDEVLEDYAVNILTTVGESHSDVVCEHTGDFVQLCKVVSTKGNVYTVACTRNETPGNDKYSCVINSLQTVTK